MWLVGRLVFIWSPGKWKGRAVSNMDSIACFLDRFPLARLPCLASGDEEMLSPDMT